MAVSMEQVRAALEPEEPDYAKASALGPDAVPHLQALVAGDDPMLASKAAYLASLIADERSREVVEAAAHHGDPIVRVAAAAAARNLPAEAASAVLVDLVTDADPGVRKVARSSAPDEPSEELSQRLAEAPEEPGAEEQGTAGPVEPPSFGLMPGEEAGQGRMPGETGGLMPGESPSRMPGETG